MGEEQKIAHLARGTQWVLTDWEGYVRQSCETLLPLRNIPHALFDTLPWLSRKLLQNLPLDETLTLYDHTLGRYRVDAHLRCRDTEEGIVWEIVFEDRSDFYEQLERKQLERDGQYFALTQEILQLKKQLLNQQSQEQQRIEAARYALLMRWRAIALPLVAAHHPSLSEELAHLLHIIETDTPPEPLEARFFPAQMPSQVWEVWQPYLTDCRWENDIPINLYGQGQFQTWRYWLLTALLTKPQRLILRWLPNQKKLCITADDQAEWQVPFLPLPAPRVLLEGQDADGHYEQLHKSLTEQGFEVFWAQKAADVQQTTGFFLSWITQNPKNPYIAHLQINSTYPGSPKDIPTLTAYLRSPKPLKTMIPKQALDLSYIRQIVDDQPEMMRNLLGILEKNLEEYPLKMQHEWETGDIQALQETAHKFKSCTAYTNLDAFNKTLSAIEASQENQLSSEEIEAHLEAVLEASVDILAQVRQNMEAIG